MPYDTYGNWIQPKDEGNVQKVDLEESNPSLYNITSTYINELPPQTKQKFEQFLTKITTLLQDESYVNKFPIFKQIQDAIEMKQFKKQNQVDLAKNYKEAYFMNVDTGVYTYFHIDEKAYKSSREIIKTRTNEIMVIPVEITSEDGVYSVMTVKLSDPHFQPNGAEIKDNKGYKLMWQLIGFREFSDNVPCIKQFEGTVLMIGSGKMALQRSAHNVRWQTNATIKDGYNEQILFLRKNYKNIIYSPLDDDGYLPYLPQKGVYIETSTKNKPTYGKDDISNSAVYFQSNNRGILKSTANTNGDGTPCQCDQINIASAHKLTSTTHDNQKINSIRKVHLMFNRIFLRE